METKLNFILNKAIMALEIFIFVPDNKEADNTDMYASARHKLGKIVYCAECNSKVISLKDLDIDLN